MGNIADFTPARGDVVDAADVAPTRVKRGGAFVDPLATPNKSFPRPDPVADSLLSRVFAGRRPRVNDPSFVGRGADNVPLSTDDIFGYFRDVDGEIKPTTWGEIDEAFGFNPNLLGGLTADEIEKLRRDLYNQIDNVNFAATPEGVVAFDGLPDTTKRGRGGGGGGAGPVEPIFIPQDANSVREQIRNYVIATTGTGNTALIDIGMAAFTQSEKQRFTQRETADIDPWQAMKESIRGTSAYKAVHSLRPDSVDEMEWVTGRQAKLRQLGISAMRAEGAGISAAISGSTDEALTGQARIVQVEGTGRLLQAHRESLKQSANAALGLV